MPSSTTAKFPSTILVALLTAALAVPAVRAQEAPDRFQPAYQAIDTAARRLMAEHRMPGLALALTSRRKLLFHRTYGFADLKLRTPVTSETLFQIGSISKSFTAIALMKLAEGERFDLDQPIAAYLPWFAVHSDHRPVTAHHLLSHTAGITANLDGVTSSPFMAWSVRNQGTAWEPGTRFHYSNVGYQILHQLIEGVSRRTYAELVRERIFQPLGMGHSSGEILLASRSAQAIGYIEFYDDRPPHRSRPLVEAPFVEYRIGDGCVLSTADDMAAYVRMILNRGATADGRLLSAEGFDRLATAYTQWPQGSETLGAGYGIGVSTYEGRDFLGHSGGMVGFVSNMTADMTEGFGAVALANGPQAAWRVAYFALDALRAAARGQPMPPLPVAEDPEMVESAADYTAVYSSVSGEKLRLEAAGGRLLLRRGDDKIALEKLDQDTFYTPHPDFDRYPFHFVKNEQGQMSEMIHGSGWYTNELYEGPRQVPAPAAWQAYVGRYRSYSPWFPTFEIVMRKGQLIAITGLGGETSYDEIVLTPLGPDLFRIGEEPTPETLRFEAVVSGRALSAVWSGHRFFLF